MFFTDIRPQKDALGDTNINSDVHTASKSGKEDPFYHTKYRFGLHHLF